MSIEQIEIRIQATEKIEFDLQRYTIHRFPKIYYEGCKEFYKETWLIQEIFYVILTIIFSYPNFFPIRRYKVIDAIFCSVQF